MEKKKWNRFKVLNLINEKYNLYPFEITSKHEADEFWRDYFGPLVDISPNVDDVDAEIAFHIIDKWQEREELGKAIIPLLGQSTIHQQL